MDFFQFREAFNSRQQIDKKVKFSGKPKKQSFGRTMKGFFENITGIKDNKDKEIMKIFRGSKPVASGSFEHITSPASYKLMFAEKYGYGPETGNKYVYFITFDNEKFPSVMALSDRIQKQDLDSFTSQYEHAVNVKLRKKLHRGDYAAKDLISQTAETEPELDPRTEELVDVLDELSQDWNPQNYEENVWRSFESGYWEMGGEENDDEAQSEFIADHVNFYLEESFEGSTKIGNFKKEPFKGKTLLKLSRENLYDGLDGIPGGNYLYAVIKGKYTDYQKKGFGLAGSDLELTAKDIISYDKGEMEDYL